MEPNQLINNKENLSSLNNQENQPFYQNKKKYEEEKNDTKIKNNKNFIIENNSLNNNNNSDNISKNSNSNNSLKDGKNNNNSKNNSSNDKNKNNELNKISFEKEEILSNEFMIDEIKLKVDYDKIESELNRLRNNNNNNNNNNSDNIENIEDYQNINNKDNKNQIISLCSNSQIDFYYSDEEDDKSKQINTNNEKIKLNQENLDNINHSADENKKINEKNNSNKYINKKIFDKIEYGIDETGNPISVKIYNEEIAKNIKCKKLIAYIIQCEDKEKNYLINLKGEIIPKMEDGDFNYKDDNIRIIIKNFDVQHPKLRVYGARQRYSSIFVDEENNSQNVKKDLPKENNHLLLFKQIKENIKYPGKKNYNIYFSPIQNMNNYYKRNNLNENIINNDYFKVWKNRYSHVPENRRVFHYKRNKNDILYRKKLLKRLNNHSLINLSKNRNCLILKKTNEILNKSENREIYNYNRNTNIIDKYKNNSNVNNIFLENSQMGYIRNNTWRINRTPSPVLREIIPQPDNFKNRTSRINMYQVKRFKKDNNNRIFTNFNNDFKLNLDNKTNNNNNNLLFNNNSLFNNSETQISKNSYSSYFKTNNNFNNNNKKEQTNHILNNNNNDLKSSFSSSFMSNNSSYHKKIGKNILSKKRLSANSCQLASTLNNIAKNIKNIENNLKSALEKINVKNNILNNNKNNNEPAKSDISIPLYNTNYNNTANYFSYNCNNNKKKVLKNKINNNFDIKGKINLKKIPLNKKFKISTSPNKNFQCTVLSYEANKMIKDYINKSLQHNKSESNNKKKNLYNIIKNSENKNKNKLIMNKIKVQNNNKLNNLSKKKLNRSYNIEPKSEKNNLLKIEKTKKSEADNKVNKFIKLRENKSYNKSFDKNKTKKIEIKKNNIKKINNKIIPIQNNLNINFYDKQNKHIIKKDNPMRLINKVKRQKMAQKNKKQSCQTTSINSLKEFELMKNEFF